MDVRINEVTSNIHVSDARALLSPEVMDQIVRAVAAHLQQAERERRQREQDVRVERRAASLD